MNITEVINNYTENEELRAVLNEYFSKEGTRGIHSKLRLLDKLSGDEKEKIAVVKQSIDKGWRGFYRAYDIKESE